MDFSEFEEKYGTDEYLKLCFSVVNRVLVEKHITSMAEIVYLMEQEMEERIKSDS